MSVLQSGLGRHIRPSRQNASYEPANALDDLPSIVYAMDEFLGNKMVESEEYLRECDPKSERLYFTTGVGLIQTVKSLLSYADEDLLKALQTTKHANHISSLHRKKAGNVVYRLSGYLSGATHGAKWYNTMSPMELHAELTYVESLFEKALIGIVYSGDWFAFIKEALNMRACVTSYRALYSFLQSKDAAHADVTLHDSDPPLPHDRQDPSIDPHLRSGVYLGAGLLNVILSLLPSRLLSLMEIFGLGSDRKLGLDILQAAGGWVEGKDEPTIGIDKEGVRRPICDLGLLIFHLVLSTFTFECVDMDFAGKVLDWNIKRWPEGIFPLIAAGRLSLSRAEPKKAVEFYQKALASQEQYRNLWHMCWWELAISYTAAWDIENSMKMWNSLMKEASWSKAIYTYGYACCLVEFAYTLPVEEDGEKGGDENSRSKLLSEAKALMEKVPELRQRIAGKSIPLEKFVARRAKKYLASLSHRKGEHDGHLPPALHPLLELGMLFGGIAHAGSDVIETKLLPMISRSLAILQGEDGYETKNGKEHRGHWWDDLCLVKFLQGLCFRYLAYPDPAASAEVLAYQPTKGRETIDKEAESSLRFVFENGKQIEWDHHLVYMAHFEYGRLLACRSDTVNAKKELELVLSGKPLEVNERGRKAKYSLEGTLHMRTTGAISALEKGNKRL